MPPPKGCAMPARRPMDNGQALPTVVRCSAAIPNSAIPEYDEISTRSNWRRCVNRNSGSRPPARRHNESSRLDAEREGLPVCGDHVIEPSVIAWCTGFVPDYSWISLPIIGHDGFPVHNRCVIPNASGLFLLGLRFQHRMSSSLIGGVGKDAEWIAHRIAQRVDAVVDV